jgi:16S rRNA (guanine966-N2)-methyltransferase
MRIIAGTLRGRPLATPPSYKTRPTTDRTRETVFNILMHRYPQALEGVVLDLFAGSGALGLEALSRGALAAVFVEKDKAAQTVLSSNITALKVQDRVHLMRGDALRLSAFAPKTGVTEPVSLVFCDPPYGHNLGSSALSCAIRQGWTRPGALIVLEERADLAPETLLPENLVCLDIRKTGPAQLLFARWDGLIPSGA